MPFDPNSVAINYQINTLLSKIKGKSSAEKQDIFEEGKIKENYLKKNFLGFTNKNITNEDIINLQSILEKSEYADEIKTIIKTIDLNTTETVFNTIKKDNLFRRFDTFNPDEQQKINNIKDVLANIKEKDSASSLIQKKNGIDNTLNEVENAAKGYKNSGSALNKIKEVREHANAVLNPRIREALFDEYSNDKSTDVPQAINAINNTTTDRHRLYDQATGVCNKNIMPAAPTDRNIETLEDYLIAIAAIFTAFETLANDIQVADDAPQDLTDWKNNQVDPYLAQILGYRNRIEKEIEQLKLRKQYLQCNSLVGLKALSSNENIYPDLKNQIDQDIEQIETIITTGGSLAKPTTYNVEEIKQYINRFHEYNSLIDHKNIQNGKELTNVDDIREQRDRIHAEFDTFTKQTLPGWMKKEIKDATNQSTLETLNADREDIREDIQKELNGYSLDSADEIQTLSEAKSTELELRDKTQPVGSINIPVMDKDNTSQEFQDTRTAIKDLLQNRIQSAKAATDDKEKNKQLGALTRKIEEAEHNGVLDNTDANNLRNQILPNYNYIPEEYEKSNKKQANAMPKPGILSRALGNSQTTTGHQGFSHKQWEKANEFWTHYDTTLKDSSTSDEEKAAAIENIALLNRAFKADEHTLTGKKRKTAVIVTHEGGIVSVIQKDKVEEKIKQLDSIQKTPSTIENCIQVVYKKPETLLGLEVEENENILYQRVFQKKPDPETGNLTNDKIIAYATQDGTKVTDLLKEDQFGELSPDDQVKWCLEQAALALVEAEHSQWVKISVSDTNPKRAKMKYAALIYLQHKAIESKSFSVGEYFGFSKKPSWDISKITFEGSHAENVGRGIGQKTGLKTTAQAQKEADFKFIKSTLGQPFVDDLKGKNDSQQALNAKTPNTTRIYKESLYNKKQKPDEPIRSNEPPRHS